MKKLITGVVAAVALAGLVAPSLAQDKKGVKVGTLRCHESSGWGFVFGSSRDLKCVFSGPEKGAKPARFTGKIKRYGVDIGYQANAVLLWAVATTSEKFVPGEIAGTYAGVTAEAAWAAGLGTNILVGGSKKGVALQPLAVEGIAGANIAAGVVEVEIQPAK